MAEAPGRAEDFLAGGGEMGRRTRELDGSATPLGPVAGWPRSLKDAVRLILTNRFPMFVWWGLELIDPIQRRLLRGHRTAPPRRPGPARRGGLA